MSEVKPRTRLYVEKRLAAGAHLSLDADQAHYVQHVLRHKAEERIRLFNAEDGEWYAHIAHLHKKKAELVVGEQLHAPLSVPDVWVLFAPIKYGKIDFLVQKVTELGAARIQPIMTEHTIVHRINYDRLKANAVEAVQQCERTAVPDVAEAVSLRQLLAEWPEDRVLVYGDESGVGEPIGGLASQEKPQKWAILIGPEGGFSAEEHALLQKHSQGKPVGLGPRILRADTAAITLLSITQSIWGDWDIAPHYVGA